MDCRKASLLGQERPSGKIGTPLRIDRNISTYPAFPGTREGLHEGVPPGGRAGRRIKGFGFMGFASPLKGREVKKLLSFLEQVLCQSGKTLSI
jgi:hypothetical protein